MKLSAFLLFLGVALPLAAADLSLTEVPATDARAFWTWNGISRPLRNRNLSGGTIRIGTREFAKGLCGHTPFSNIYRLDGLADEFRAEIGVEANDHEKDPILPGDPLPKVTFRFFADFREVFRRECALGESPVPVRLDLRGIRHFEIQAKASGGRTSHRCRTALGNPVFRTGDPERLIRHLNEQVFHPQGTFITPSAPNWKEIPIRNIRFRESASAFKIRNRTMELIVVPERGGRILHLSPPGGENLLAQERPCPRERERIRGGYPDGTSGHFLRPLPPPSLLPDDPVLETLPYSVEFPAEGTVLLRSGKSPVHDIAAEYRIQIHSDFLIIDNTIRNTAPIARELGVWSLTRIDPSRLRVIRITDGKNGKARTISPAQLNPEREISVSGPVRMEAEFRDGTILVLRAEKAAGVKFFRSGTFLELEFLGFRQVLAPGGTVSLRERWELSGNRRTRN